MQVYIRLRSASSEYEWQRGQVVRRVETDPTARMAVVQLADGRLVEVNEEQDVLMANAVFDGESDGKVKRLADVEDLDALTHLHEASLVEYLKERYSVNHVYCRSGVVLIAVNPFKDIPGMYDLGTFQKRIVTAKGEQCDDARLPPHVFSMAESAFQSLRRRRRLTSEPKKNQTILVSGESGAGKTESTKFIMQYLAAISSSGSTDDDSAPDYSRFLLSANPILESFGNARTLRNDNSSRFGKFVKMFFNELEDGDAHRMHIVRTSVETYLLERVRVVHQGLGERNFHIFYELLKGATSEVKSQLFLGDLQASDFRYVNVGRCFARNDRVDDSRQFSKVMEAMDVIGFSKVEQGCILKIVSGLLHLGNVTFVLPSGHEDDDPTNAPPCEAAMSSASKLSAAQHLNFASQLLHLDEDDLESSLTVRTINVSGETFQVNLSQTQCAGTRDALARSLYGWLFLYLVKRVNDTSPNQIRVAKEGEGAEDSRPCISVLDIFGFEEFDVNQFEQFCINYANEKLQHQFIKDILETEQDAHIKEGISWEAVEYHDNAQCLDMIEQRPSGIFSLLDEECLMPKGSDASFARKMYLQMKKHSTFVASKKDQVDFTFQVHHYAGHVKYLANGFCEKNKDQPNSDFLGLLMKTSDDGMREMIKSFIESEQPVKREHPRIRRRSSVIGAVGIGSQFKQQLANLLDVVQQTQTHYIRCIKPNDQNQRDEFDMAKVAKQLRYGGVLKAIEITRQSFPIRMPHAEFLGRYTILASAFRSQTIDMLVKALKIDGAEVGKTRVFLRQPSFDGLERARDHKRSLSATSIQSRWRAIFFERRYVRSMALVRSVQVRWKAICERKRRLRLSDSAARRIQRSYRSWRRKYNKASAQAARSIQRAQRFQSKASSIMRSPIGRGTVEDVESESYPKSAEVGAPSPCAITHTSIPTAGSGRTNNLTVKNSGTVVATRERFPHVAHSQDGVTLERALDELERLRLRAEAAEAALAQMAQNQDSRTFDPRSAEILHMPERTSLSDQFGNTSLHIVVQSALPEEVYKHIANGFSSIDDLNRSENLRGYTPLHIAVRRGCVEVIGIFFRPEVLPHVNLGAVDRDGNTALHLAVQLNDELADRVMELLLCFGADANSANYLKQTPLHLCTMIQRVGSVCVELVEKLLRYGGNPNILDLVRRSPLHYCVDKDMDEVAIALVRNGADMNLPDSEGVRVVSHPKATHLLRYLRATPSWIPESEVSSCMICQEIFSYFFRSKCHCDRCGRVCCSDCCPSSSSWKGRFCFDCKHYQHIS